MKSSTFRFVVIAATLLVGPPTIMARLLPDWPYEKLLQEADLVVIAEAVKTQDAKDKPPDQHWPYEFVAQNTTFKVLGCVKGSDAGSEIKVLHFKFGELKKGVGPKSPQAEANQIIDGPLLVAFRSDWSTDTKGKKTDEPKPHYLLFLKKLKDGRYEPICGQIDPALAVREMFMGHD